jgi:hypothetical protein
MIKIYKIYFDLIFKDKTDISNQKFIPLSQRLNPNKHKKIKREEIKKFENWKKEQFEEKVYRKYWNNKEIEKFKVDWIVVENYKTKYSFINGKVNCSVECRTNKKEDIENILQIICKSSNAFDYKFLRFDEFERENFFENFEEELRDPDWISESERQMRNDEQLVSDENKEKMRIVRSHKKTNSGLANLNSIYKRN